MSQEYRRKVFYISGYHDFGYGYFGALLKRGVKILNRRQARSAQIDISEPDLVGRNHHVKLSSSQCTTEYVYLGWNDIADARLKRPAYRSMLAYPWYLAIAIRYGYYRKLAAMHKPFLYLILWIDVVILGMMAGCGYALGWLGARYLGLAGATLGGSLGVLLGAWLADLYLRKFYLKLLVDGWAFGADWVRGKAPQLEARMAEFAKTVAEAARDDTLDEVLVVGYSWGTVMSVEVMDQALALLGSAFQPKCQLSLLNMGAVHVMPCAALSDNRHHHALARLSADSRVYWAEVFSPADPFNIPYINPVEALTDRKTATSPQMLSLRVADRMSKQAYRRKRFNLWDMHFSYLKEAEHETHFSFTRCLTAPAPLIENYWRNPSVVSKGDSAEWTFGKEKRHA